MKKNLRILVAPLNWGLGHITRCIPVVRELMIQGAEVVLAGNSVQRDLFFSECPECAFLPLAGYEVRYSYSKKNLPATMALQAPAIFSTVRKEHIWLKQAVTTHKIDGVISDNRFGLHHPNIPCVFITHQLRIQSGMGSVFDEVLQKINYNQINRFHQCWVPDFEGTPNLSGLLSHPRQMPRIPTVYINPLSRISTHTHQSQNNELLFIISGPEPQRTVFEEILLRQVEDLNEPVTIVRGLPADRGVTVRKNIMLFHHLPTAEMVKRMQRARLVVCRSGYSSVMDINAMKLRSLLVPTPGQTEQEYLATYLTANRFAPSCHQQDLNLKKMLESASTFPYSGFIQPDPAALSKAVKHFLADCEQTRNTSGG